MFRPKRLKGSIQRVRLAVELLESRDCPSGLTLSAQVLAGHQVELSGMLQADQPSGLPVTFSGAVVGSTTTDANGYFDYTTSSATLGSVFADAVDQNQEPIDTAQATIATNAPAITLSSTYSSQYGVTLTGAVSGIDAAGATVSISGVASGSVTTDGSGNFTLATSFSGPGTISASTTDPWGQSADGAVVTVDSPPSVTLNALVLPDHQVMLSGVVSGAEPSGATITFSGAASGSTTTDSSGYYSFTTSSASLGAVYAVATDMQQHSSDTTEAAIATAAPTITLSRTYNAQNSITLTGTMTGIDAAYAAVPFSGIVNTATTTDASGNFTLATTYSGSGTIYTWTTDTWAQSFGNASVWVDNAPTVTLNAQVLPGHQVLLSGVVAGANPGGAMVTFSGAASGSTTTDGSGFYSFITSAASLGAVYAFATDIEQHPSDTTSATIATDAPTITLASAYSSAYGVTLTGAVTGIDAAGATVTISGVASGSVTTDGSGNFTLATSFWSPGSIFASAVDSWGQSAGSAGVTVDSPPTVSLNTQVLPGHQVQLSGVVAGANPGGATVTFSGAVSGSTTTDGSGHYSFTTSAASLGAVYAVATDNAQHPSDTIAPIIALDVPTITLAVSDVTANTVTLSGKLTDLDAAGQTISVTGAPVSSVTTDAEGNFSLTFAPESADTVTVSESDLWGQASNTAAVDGQSIPLIQNFTATNNGTGSWTFAGIVVGSNVAGLVVTFGGVGPVAGQTATVNADGTFSLTVDMGANANGIVTARTTNQAGQNSNTALASVRALVNTMPGVQDTNEDADLLFSTSQGDPISVLSEGDSSIEQITLTATNGVLTLASTANLSFSFADHCGTGTGDGWSDPTLTFRGTAAAINTALDGLIYCPNPGYLGSASVHIVADDMGASGGRVIDQNTTTIDVTIPPAQLYANYLADVAQANQVYSDTVVAAAATRDAIISAASAAAQSAADQLYAAYQSTVSQANQVYAATVSNAEAAYTSAIMAANVSADASSSQAQVALDAALASADAAYQGALSTAGQAYQSSQAAADAAYAATVAISQAARDQAATNAQNTQAALDSAEAALATTIASANAVRDAANAAALSSYQAAQAQAQQTQSDTLASAAQIYQAALTAADAVYAATIAPFQAACDQAAANVQNAQAALDNASAALSAATTTAASNLTASQNSAAATYQTAQDQANQAHAAALNAAAQTCADAFAAADAADAATVITLQAAADQAAANAQNTQAAFDSAVAALSAATTAATADLAASQNSAATAYQSSQDQANQAHAAALDAAAQACADAFAAADTAYATSVSPYQTAWDDAYAASQANPDDPDAQAAFNAADVALNSAIAQATADQAAQQATALAADQAAVTDADQTLADALAAAAQTNQDALAAASVACASAIQPYQTARDQADADNQNAQAVLAAATAALTDGTATAAADKQAAQAAALSANQAAVADADQVLADDLAAAAQTNQDAQTAADAVYVSAVSPFQAARDQADADNQNAQAVLAAATAALTDATANALAAWQAAQVAAPAAYQAAVTSSDQTLADAQAAAAQIYQNALAANDTAYASTVAPAQAVRDQADADNQNAQANLNAADAALSNTIAQATTDHDAAYANALATQQAAYNAAAQVRNDAHDAALTAFQASLALAGDSQSAAENAAWDTYAGAKTATDAAFAATEDAAWTGYLNGLDAVNSNLAFTEAGAQSQFDSQVAVALTSWQVTEQSVWGTYAANMANLAGGPMLGERDLAPAAVQAVSVDPPGQLAAQARQRPTSPAGSTMYNPIVLPPGSQITGAGWDGLYIQVGVGGTVYRVVLVGNSFVFERQTVWLPVNPPSLGPPIITPNPPSLGPPIITPNPPSLGPPVPNRDPTFDFPIDQTPGLGPVQGPPGSSPSNPIQLPASGQSSVIFPPGTWIRVGNGPVLQTR